MKGRASNEVKLALVVAALLTMVGSAYGREKPKGPQFKYAAGTEILSVPCEGNLEVTSTALAFVCPEGSVAVPYPSISLMQYRPDISRTVRKMKLKWKLKPPYGSGKQNRYLTVLYRTEGETHAMVLEVSPQAMRPYLAAIDLKAGKRVEVKGYEEYP